MTNNYVPRKDKTLITSRMLMNVYINESKWSNDNRHTKKQHTHYT